MVYTVCKDKNNLQVLKYIVIGQLEEVISVKRVNAVMMPIFSPNILVGKSRMVLTQRQKVRQGETL